MNHACLSSPVSRLILIAFAALFCALARGQEAEAKLCARVQGSEVQLALQITIQPGWHLYHTELGPEDALGLPTTVQLDGQGVLWGEPRFSPPKRLEQPIGKNDEPTWAWGHEGTIVVFARGTLANPSEVPTIRAKIKGLTCEDEGSCIPYAETVEAQRDCDAALFASFPADLVAPAKTGTQASGPTKGFTLPGLGGPPSRLGGSGQKAEATLFVRQAGGELRAVIEIAMEGSYHLYHDELGQPDSVGKPTKITFASEKSIWSAPRFPMPKRFEQPKIGEGNRDTWIWGHEGTIRVHAVGRAVGGSADDLEVKLAGLTCLDNGECVPYKQTITSSGPGDDALFSAFPADLALDEADSTDREGAISAPRNAVAGAPDLDWDSVQFPDYDPEPVAVLGVDEGGSERSLFVWLLFAMLAGALLNVMPCVLPVVSIKVLSFVQQAGESRARVFHLGLAFSAGILVVFEALAGFAITANEGWGAQFKDDTFKFTLIAVVFAFALSLFDVFEIGVPTKVGEIAAIKREGLVDAFFKGIMATLLATPCSGPFLGSTLAWALAQTKPTILLVFTAVGVGMAAPYAVLTSNPALLRFVPKPGAWMDAFKKLMGFLLMATVVFLFISVREEDYLYVLTLLGFVGLACWVYGHWATFERTTPQRLGVLAIAALIVAGGAHFSFRTFPALLTEDELWQPFDPVVLERMHREGKPVLIDFTADWCLTCKTNENLVYTSDEIRTLLEEKGVTAMKADETHDSPETEAIKRLREELGANSIPFMAIFPGGEWHKPFTFKDLVTRKQVGNVLEALPDRS